MQTGRSSRFSQPCLQRRQHCSHVHRFRYPTHFQSDFLHTSASHIVRIQILPTPVERLKEGVGNSMFKPFRVLMRTKSIGYNPDVVLEIVKEGGIRPLIDMIKNGLFQFQIQN